MWGAKNIVRSKIGRAFIAVRDNDVSAEIIGIPIFRFKLIAFSISAFYAGAAGALFKGVCLRWADHPVHHAGTGGTCASVDQNKRLL